MGSLSDAFRRQRTNVMLSSVFLAIYFASGAQIEKINIFGNYILINNHNIANIIIIAFHCYFILRYWQYYKKEGKEVEKAISIFYNHQTKNENKYFEKILTKNHCLNSYLNIETIETHFNFFRTSAEYNYSLGEEKKLYKRDEKISLLKNRRYFYLIVPLFNQTLYGMRADSKELYHILDKAKNPEDAFSYLEDDSLDKKMFSSNKKTFDFLKSSPNFKFVGVAAIYGSCYVFETYLRYNVIHLLFMRIKGLFTYCLNDSTFTDYYFPFLLITISGCLSLAGLMVK